jgi:acyl-coenzyme A thioesterase PaaI-like protein
MRKINNPFTSLASKEDYNCFGCSPFNETGLQLEFWEDGNEIIAKWKPKKSFEGWMNVLHGGIQATLMDEIASWLVFIKLKTAGVTSGLKINYIKPVYISRGIITLHARLSGFNKPLAKIKCTLSDGVGTQCAEAEAEYFCYPEKIAKAKFKYPGVEAFYSG